MKLYDTGVYLQNGKEIIPAAEAQLPVSREDAARNTIAYQPNAVKFKEVSSSKELAVIANTIGLILMVILSIPILLVYKNDLLLYFDDVMLAVIFPILTMFPHELLHALCFKEDVYLYTNFKQGMVFVLGTETMSKKRFIFMSFLPNLVFGFLPYCLSFLGTKYLMFALWGVIAVAMGAGDYCNVFNALTQMPKGARTYLYQMNSYWYIPENK